MKYTFKIIASLLLSVSFALNACDKDITELETNNNQPTVNEGVENSPIVIDGKKMEWHFSLKPRTLTKGMIIDETEYYPNLTNLLQIEYGEDYKLIDTLRFTYNKKNYELKLLRIDRKSEPGKYFYVMIDNLDVKIDTACWAYADNEMNVKKYGRLYTWFAANALANKISMKLPVYKANNPTEKLITTKLPVKAKLLSYKDVCDIIECDTIGHVPEYGYTINRHQEDQMDDDFPKHGMFELPAYYFDVFLGGLEGSASSNYIDYSRGERILGGYRDVDQAPIALWHQWDGNGWYTWLNKRGFIWTRDKPSNTLSDLKCSHYPLCIQQIDNHGRVYNYSAFINSGAGNKHGYSVRYIFEPLYK